MFIHNFGCAEIAANREILHSMLEDTLASVLLSLGGVLFYDYFFKHETGDQM